MKRLQIMIEEELDDALGREAAREGTSKAALIRRFVRERLKPLPPLHEDPLWEMVGASGDVEPVEDIDEYLYGPIGDEA
ncbi:MAG: CopG family transcriptional regulator [Gaiellaceae bacterium]